MFHGGYHGGVLYFGPTGRPLNVPHKWVFADYNDTESVRRAFAAHPDDIGCALVESMIGASGCIPGEPDFPTPAHIIEAAAAAGRRGETKYAPNAGIPELRAALVEKLGTVNSWDVTPEQIQITAGSTEALFLSLRLLLDSGNGILLPDPGWPNYRMIAQLLDAEPIGYPLTAANGFVPDPADLERLVTERTRAMLINSPSNPLGSVIARERLVELADFVDRHDLWLVCDECYEELTFDGPFVSAAAVAPRDRMIGIYSFSKTYAMTGWRVGYAVMPEPLARTANAVQEAIVSCVTTPAQWAALAALEGPQDIVASMRESYRHRRDVLLAVLDDVGLAAQRPAGAFYAWVDVSAAGLSSVDLAARLVREERVAVAPGAGFGALGDGAVRLCVAADEDDLVEGARRLGAFVAEQSRSV